MPVCSAICDIVTPRSPCSATSAAVVSRMASRTSRRCVSIVSVHSFGMVGVYATTPAETLWFDRDTLYRYPYHLPETGRTGGAHMADPPRFPEPEDDSSRGPDRGAARSTH